jgi:hypothetical protein
MNTKEEVSKLPHIHNEDREITHQVAKLDLSRTFNCFWAGALCESGFVLLLSGKSPVFAAACVAAGVVMYRHTTRVWREIYRQSK